MRYKTEAEFSHALVNHLRNRGWFVQRIETGTTGRGVPDIYAVTEKGTPLWIELKRIHQSVLKLAQPVTITWRAGQQAWLRQITVYKQLAYTLACFDDCILAIRHDKLYKGNVVIPYKDCMVYDKISSIF